MDPTNETGLSKVTGIHPLPLLYDDDDVLI